MQRRSASLPRKLREFLARHEHEPCYVITSTSKIRRTMTKRKSDQAFPGVFQEIFRQRRFLEPEGNERMVVLRAGRGK